MNLTKKHTATVLSIAGFDPCGGAGILIDTKTIHALGGYAFCITTALTAQSSQGVKYVQECDIKMFKEQLETLLSDVKVDAVKIGMLANVEIISVVVAMIDKYKLQNIVLDTVLVSSSGKILLDPDAIDLMEKELFPRVDIVTPNLDEINTLLSKSYAGKEDEVLEIAEAFSGKGVKAILVKGGHSLDESSATDYLVQNSVVNKYSSPRVDTSHTHGTGCLLSSAIAVNLAKGENFTNSVAKAKKFLYEKLINATELNFNYKEINSTRKEPIF